MLPACRPPSPRVSRGAALCPCQQPHPSRLRGCLLCIADHHIVCFLIWSATCIVARHRTAVRLGSSTSNSSHSCMQAAAGAPGQAAGSQGEAAQAGGPAVHEPPRGSLRGSGHGGGTAPHLRQLRGPQRGPSGWHSSAEWGDRALQPLQGGILERRDGSLTSVL